MRSARLLQILAPVLLLPAMTAYADSITTFSLSGNSDLQGGNTITLPGSPISGTVTIDTTTGVVEAINLNEPIENLSFGGSSVEYASNDFPFVEINEFWSVKARIFMDLYLPVSTLVGYDGGSVCSVDYPCADYAMSTAGDLFGGNFIYGELSPAATPEPSSLTLLALGAVAMAGLARRKQFAY